MTIYSTKTEFAYVMSTQFVISFHGLHNPDSCCASSSNEIRPFHNLNSCFHNIEFVLSTN
jgi:hypothetical protein